MCAPGFKKGKKKTWGRTKCKAASQSPWFPGSQVSAWRFWAPHSADPAPRSRRQCLRVFLQLGLFVKLSRLWHKKAGKASFAGVPLRLWFSFCLPSRERLKAGGEGDDRGWHGWMASPTRRIWVWASSGSWWQGSLACCSPWGCRVGHDWTTELNWTLLLLEVTLGLGKAHRHILGWQELASDRLSVSSGKLKSCGKQKDGVFKFQSPTQAKLILTCLHRPALSLEVETYTNAYFYRQQKTCIMFNIHVTHLLTKLMVWWRSTVKTFKG